MRLTQNKGGQIEVYKMLNSNENIESNVFFIFKLNTYKIEARPNAVVTDWMLEDIQSPRGP